MTREEAKAIIRKEYLCVDRDCDIERSCGKCDLMMPSKEPILEAYKMAIQALEQEPSGDCISRQAVLNTEYQVKIINDIEYVMLSEVQMKMRKLPPVKPQTGHWIIMGDRYIKCSECGHITKTESPDIYHFCMVCGANMSENPTSSKPEISSYYGLKSYVRERSE